MTEKIILLGDSIFDNQLYAGEGCGVIDYARKALDGKAEAELHAIDGTITRQLSSRIVNIPGDATQLYISTGGNDALGVKQYLEGIIPNEDIIKTLRSRGMAGAGNMLHALGVIQCGFRDEYRRMLKLAKASGLPLTVCTIYDAVPGLESWHRTALSLFNDVIIREAGRVGASVIDLREICNEPEDYADISPIEPSARGSQKIAAAISRVCSDIIRGLGTGKWYAW
jgi:hypothetical protein